MSNDPDEIRAQIERTRQNLSTDVNVLADEVNPKTMLRRSTERVRRPFGTAKDRVFGTASSAQSTAVDTLHSAQDRLHVAGDYATEAPARITSGTQGSPIAAGVIAFGAGLLVAGLLPASQREQQAAGALKEKSQPLLDEARTLARESAENLKEPAQEAVQTVKDTAAEAATTVTEEGRSTAADVKEEVRTS